MLLYKKAQNTGIPSQYLQLAAHVATTTSPIGLEH